MSYTNYGGPKPPTSSITVSAANSTPFSKGEMQKNRQKREKNQEPIPDTPRYKAKVKREREAREREEREALALLQEEAK